MNFVTEVFDLVDHSLAQRSAPLLALGIASIGVHTADSISQLADHSSRLVKASRLMRLSDTAFSVVPLAFHVGRRLEKPVMGFGPVLSTDKELRASMLTASGGLLVTSYNVLSGKELLPRRRQSKVGRAASLLDWAYWSLMLVENGREYYRRSPELQQRVEFARIMTPIIVKVKARELVQTVYKRLVPLPQLAGLDAK